MRSTPLTSAGCFRAHLLESIRFSSAVRWAGNPHGLIGSNLVCLLTETGSCHENYPLGDCGDTGCRFTLTGRMCFRQYSSRMDGSRICGSLAARREGVDCL